LDENMYTEIVLEHYRNPANFGNLQNATIESYDENPMCGDKIKMQLKLDKKKIQDIKFSGDGCAISIAATSMLTSRIKGMQLGDVKKLTKEDVFKLLGIELTPIRIKCALLPLKVLKMALVSYLNEKQNIDWNDL